MDTTGSAPEPVPATNQAGGGWPMRIFSEDLVEQARRLSISPATNESPGSWRDRVRCAALTSERSDVISADVGGLSAGWGGDPHSFAAELRRIANSWGEGYRLPSTLRDAADEIERLAALAAQPATSQEPFGYWVTQKHADPILLRKPAYIPEPSDLRTVTPLCAAALSQTLPAPGEVERVMAAMNAWTNGEQTITGQVWVIQGGKRVASFDGADDAWADVNRRNAEAAIAALSPTLATVAAANDEAVADHLEAVLVLLMPPGNVWRGDEPTWQTEAYALVRAAIRLLSQGGKA